MNRRRFASLNASYSVAVSALVALQLTGGADAQIQDQWRTAEKSMLDYVTEGFAIETILLERITPVSTQATVYYLRKDNTLARCTETTTRRSLAIVSSSVSCAELGPPVAK